MYESPIDLFYSITDVTKEMNEKIDNAIYTAVTNVGINISKEELIRALSYDRNQYDKGYADGLREVFADRKKGKWQKKDVFWECSCCRWFNDYSKSDFHYCPNCGAIMDTEVL